MKTKICSYCREAPPRAGQAYCLACHASYMRVNRKPHSCLTPEARARANARSYLHVYLRRGKVVRPEECAQCAARTPLHGHHTDYSKPLDVIWLCGSCHAEKHAAL